jgi:hypothetical protein
MSSDVLLTPDQIETLRSMLEKMVETGDLTDLELFQYLSPAQKRQLWAEVPLALRKALYELSQVQMAS